MQINFFVESNFDDFSDLLKKSEMVPLEQYSKIIVAVCFSSYSKSTQIPLIWTISGDIRFVITSASKIRFLNLYKLPCS